MAGRFDEHLPEVVPDTSPEAIPRSAQAQYANQLGEQYPKYPVLYDQSPKYSVDESAKLPIKQEASPTGAAAVSPYAAVTPYAETLAAGGQDPSGSSANLVPPAEAKICGLKKRSFWIIAILAFVVLAAALGGGLGGGLAARNSQLSDSPESSKDGAEGDTDGGAGAGAGGESSSGAAGAVAGGAETADGSRTREVETVTKTAGSPSEATEDKADPKATTTERPKADPTTSKKAAETTTSLLSDNAPTDSFAFQAWSKKDYKGEHTPIYRKEGLITLGFDAISYIWIPNSKDCCVTFCDDSSVRCKEWYRPESSGPFPQVYISCDGSLAPHSCK